ncbi:MAG: VOC family protein, partial [Knoellia sp.]
MTDVRWMWAFLDTVERDADGSEAFWHTVTRTEVSPRRGERGEFATLLPKRGDAWVKLQRVMEGGGVHLDLDVDRPLAEVAAEATRLGATEVARHDDVIVMTSPGGFIFCLTSWSNTGSPTTQVRDDEPDLLDQVCVDVPSDLYAGELDFWEQLTGWRRRAGALPEFTSLTRPDGIPVRLLFQRLGEPTGPVTGHIDFACRDRAASRET